MRVGKSQVFQVKMQVKSTAKSIVDETKVKGRAALELVRMETAKEVMKVREDKVR